LKPDTITIVFSLRESSFFTLIVIVFDSPGINEKKISLYNAGKIRLPVYSPVIFNLIINTGTSSVLFSSVSITYLSPSVLPRIKAPSIRPIFSPLTKISAFQSIPSKFKKKLRN